MAAKICVITGAGSGIGRAVTIALARRGFDILAVGRRKEPLVETQSLAEKDKSSGTVSVLSADVSTEAGRDSVARALPKAKGMYIVHNAAIVEPLKHIEDIKLSEFRKLMAINVEGPLFLTQALLPSLSDGGRILSIGSGLAHRGLDGLAAYGMSKAAVFLMLKTMQLEFKSKGICTTSVSPGMVDTGMQVTLRGASDPKFQATRDSVFRANFEKGGVRSPELIARFIAWVLCDLSDEEFASKEWEMADASHYPRWQDKE